MAELRQALRKFRKTGGSTSLDDFLMTDMLADQESDEYLKSQSDQLDADNQMASNQLLQDYLEDPDRAEAFRRGYWNPDRDPELLTERAELQEQTYRQKVSLTQERRELAMAAARKQQRIKTATQSGLSSLLKTGVVPRDSPDRYTIQPIQNDRGETIYTQVAVPMTDEDDRILQESELARFLQVPEDVVKQQLQEEGVIKERADLIEKLATEKAADARNRLLTQFASEHPEAAATLYGDTEIGSLLGIQEATQKQRQVMGKESAGMADKIMKLATKNPEQAVAIYGKENTFVQLGIRQKALKGIDSEIKATLKKLQTLRDKFWSETSSPVLKVKERLQELVDERETTFPPSVLQKNIPGSGLTKAEREAFGLQDIED